MVATEAKPIDAAATNREPHYEPYGWRNWPDHPWMPCQFRRALGEAQEGGGAAGECFEAAARMVPGDGESWHGEWLATAGRLQTAQNCWLRTANYHRHAEFWLAERFGIDERALRRAALA